MNVDKNRFKQVLQGAIAGSHTDLELILELYDPMIRKHSLVNGTFDKELYQYLLIHIARNIHKFAI